jgi:hypothetical protein
LNRVKRVSCIQRLDVIFSVVTLKTEAAQAIETSEQTNCAGYINPKYDRNLKNTLLEDLVSYALAPVFVVF